MLVSPEFDFPDKFERETFVFDKHVTILTFGMILIEGCLFLVMRES